MDSLRQRMVDWIRGKVNQAKTKGVVFGLSGGLDSSVVAALCVEALGSSSVLALVLPCESEKEDLTDAELVAKKFNLKTELIDLTQIFQKLKEIGRKHPWFIPYLIKPDRQALTKSLCISMRI